VSSTRREFLGATAATIAAAGAFGVPALAAAQAPNPTQGMPYDAFIARARAPFRHKQAFLATRPNGNVFVYMRNSLNGYQFGWGEGPRTLHAVAVMNGLGVAQGVGDEGWRKYRLADVLTAAGAPLRGAAPQGNPWLHASAGLAPNQTSQSAPYNMDVSAETLQQRGCEFFVCDTAMITLSMAVVSAGAGQNVEAVHADLRGLLFPGAMLVPSGASSMDALQEQHFTFYDANV
jgi:intracellular sulfur oxidation DsrE/DsrF family protein